MLMPTRESVDFSHVSDEHLEIDKRLRNWARWVKVRPHGWQTHAMWRNARTSRQWDIAPHMPSITNTLDAVVIEKAVSALPDKWRDAVRWSYVHCSNPADMAQKMGLSKQGLADAVVHGRNMLINRLM